MLKLHVMDDECADSVNFWEHCLDWQDLYLEYSQAPIDCPLLMQLLSEFTFLTFRVSACARVLRMKASFEELAAIILGTRVNPIA